MDTVLDVWYLVIVGGIAGYAIDRSAGLQWAVTGAITTFGLTLLSVVQQYYSCPTYAAEDPIEQFQRCRERIESLETLPEQLGLFTLGLIVGLGISEARKRQTSDTS